MPSNADLIKANRAKNDEFYTQYNDIQAEINAYIEYNPNVFKDKTILCPCDDPNWSNFTKFFAQNFTRFGLKKIISTSYAPMSKEAKYGRQTAIEEENIEKPKNKKDYTHGKIYILDHDTNKDNKIDVNDLEDNYIEDAKNPDGDFRSEFVTKLRDEADIIITNPPFSLFREFLNWIREAKTKKQFLMISNKNAITYKEVFPLIKNKEIWCGVTGFTKDLLFIPPKNFDNKNLSKSQFKEIDGQLLLRSPAIWLTNIDHGKRHEPLPLMTMKENLSHSKHKIIREKGYQKYDNYDAIEVPFSDAIPSDYDGIMGVPISFLDKYCPEQFEILGDSRYHDGDENANDINYVNGKCTYRRILIRRIKQ